MRFRALGLFIAVGLTTPIYHIDAQSLGCRSPGSLSGYRSDSRSGYVLNIDVGSSLFGVSYGVDMNTWGTTPAASGGSSRQVPARIECDPLIDTLIAEVQQLFSSGSNRSGAATGGGNFNGGSSTNRLRRSARATVAADQGVLVGYADRGDFTTYHAFRWTTAGLVDLGTLDPANNASRTSMATATNSNGTVVVGFSQIGSGTTQHAFRWTSSGMVDLGAPAGATRDSRAISVNGAGDVVVGDGVFTDAASFSGFRTGAFRWTAAGGFQNLGALEPGFFTIATDVTSDGSVIVGQGGVQIVVGNSSTNGSRAFRWSSTTGLQAIGPLSGHTQAVATGVSDNGKVVVGTSSAGILAYNAVTGYGTGTAFRWTSTDGIQDLRQLLVNKGLNLTGITLVAATGVSEDGQWIVGNAVTPTTPPNETRPFLVKYCDAAIGGTCADVKTATTPPAVPASFELATSSSTSPSVAAGGSASATLTVTPTGGFNQAVTFACSGLPSASTCSFSPASVTPTSGAVTTTMTITTTAPTRTGSSTWWSITRVPPVATLFVGIALVMLVSTRRRRVPVRFAWASVAIAGSVALFASCGGGGGDTTNTQPVLTGGTPAGTFAVVATATSGSGATAISKTLTINVTVTR